MVNKPIRNPLNPFEIEFTDAQQVIDFFLCDSQFQTDDKFFANIAGKNGVIFRGESCHEWDLLPSAFRENTNWSKFTPQPPCEAEKNLKKRLLSKLHTEAIAIKFFLEAADSTGIATPVDYSINKNAMDAIFGARNRSLNSGEDVDFDDVFPPKDYFRSIALAQHYGVPTRFLDWSESPLVACYFAAEKASCVSDLSGSELKILQSDKNKIVIYYFNIWGKDKSPIEVVKSPRHENSNLLSQKGVFINFKNANSFFIQNGKWPTFYDYHPTIQINKVLLPASEADSLLKLLFDLGITRHTLSPCLANAAKAYEYNHALFPKGW